MFARGRDVLACETRSSETTTLPMESDAPDVWPSPAQVVPNSPLATASSSGVFCCDGVAPCERQASVTTCCPKLVALRHIHSQSCASSRICTLPPQQQLSNNHFDTFTFVPEGSPIRRIREHVQIGQQCLCLSVQTMRFPSIDLCTGLGKVAGRPAHGRASVIDSTRGTRCPGVLGARTQRLTHLLSVQSGSYS